MKRVPISKLSLDPRIAAAALADAPDVPEPDADNPATTAQDWAQALPSTSLEQLRTRLARRRGPGRKPARIPIQLRLPPEVLDRWKATGPGWQTRMVERLSAP